MVPAGQPCSLVATAWALATDAGIDCGTFRVPDSPPADWDAGLDEGLSCAFAAQDAGLPFVLVIGLGGIDATSWTGYVGSPTGLVTMGQWQNGCISPELDQATCGTFGPADLWPFAPGFDAGLRGGIGCVDGGGQPTCICGGGACY